MSNPFDVYARSQVTVYGGGGTDDFGQPIAAIKGVVDCELSKGGDLQRDQNGDQFVPMATIYPVSTTTVVVTEGDRIAFGDTSAQASPPRNAQLVRKVEESDEDYFGWGKAVVVYTG